MDNITKSLIAVLTLGGILAFLAPTNLSVNPKEQPVSGGPVNSQAQSEAAPSEEPVESKESDFEAEDFGNFGEPAIDGKPVGLKQSSDDDDDSSDADSAAEVGAEAAIVSAKTDSAWAAKAAPTAPRPGRPSILPSRSPNVPPEGDTGDWTEEQMRN
ncbi:MAG: hypothetical protein V3V15_02295 [Sphingorhabdus sp.]